MATLTRAWLMTFCISLYTPMILTRRKGAWKGACTFSPTKVSFLRYDVVIRRYSGICPNNALRRVYSCWKSVCDSEHHRNVR